MRYNLIMSAQELSSEFKEQVVLEVVEKDWTIAETVRSYGLVPQTAGNWVKKWRKDHPESVDSEVGGEQEAARRAARGQYGDRVPEKSGFLLRAGVPVTARYAFIHRGRQEATRSP